MEGLTEADWYNLTAGKMSYTDRETLADVKSKMEFLMEHFGLEKEYKRYLKNKKKMNRRPS